MSGLTQLSLSLWWYRDTCNIFLTRTFTMTAPVVATPGRVVVTAELELGHEPRGEPAETLLEAIAA